MNEKYLSSLLKKEFLPGHVVLFSFQRKNRNFPGIAFVRNIQGDFLKDSLGNYFSVPQLARSMTNMPAFFVNGNTPEGIYRMDGFDTS
ncbi:MAG: hypothetical protein ABI729_09290, partial [Chitinophagales bacterium]